MYLCFSSLSKEGRITHHLFQHFFSSVIGSAENKTRVLVLHEPTCDPLYKDPSWFHQFSKGVQEADCRQAAVSAVLLRRSGSFWWHGYWRPAVPAVSRQYTHDSGSEKVKILTLFLELPYGQGCGSGSGVFAWIWIRIRFSNFSGYGSGSGLQTLDPDPVSARILEQKLQKVSKSDLSEESFKFMTKDRQ